jgi:GT2 family glycosyltransferase/peptidoglycan/xylan/chitin deacetylase (PgdA/CDA1 family)
VRLSVVIPTYNRREVLSRVLQTVFQQTCPPEAYEVIVVADGSTDGTAEMLRQLHPPCKFLVLEQPNRGQAAARNAGARAASGDLILFLDDDMLCAPDLVAEHIAAHSSGDRQVVFGPVHVAPESPATLATRRLRLEAEGWSKRLRREGATFPTDAVVGANSSVWRSTFLELGGFDEGFFRAREDVELGLRFWQAGIHFRFHEAAVAHQIYTKSNRDLALGDGTAYGKNEVALYRKHPQLRRYSEFAHFSEDPWEKRLARELAVRARVPIDLSAAAACWFIERFPRNNRLVRIGLRLLAVRRNIAMLHSAVGEAGGWKAFKREFGVLAPMLLYHNVGPFRPGTAPSLTISPERFEQQMRWLKLRGYTGIRCADWLSWLRGECVLPEKPVVLTFDDAYADLAEFALPILKKYGFSGTVFVVADEVGGTNSWDEREGSATLHCMTAEQMREWAAVGFEFGAHSCTHPDLRTLDLVELAKEIEGSARRLSSLLGARVRSFAYPYGDYSDAVKKCVEETFDLAPTCVEGLNGLGTDPCLLRRPMVCPKDTMLDFAFYVTLGFSPLNRLRLWRQRFRSFRRSLSPFRTAELSR